MPLSETKAKSAKAKDRRYQISDSDGLYLEVMTSGKKYWRFRYVQNGKRNWSTVGEYPLVGLQEARERRNGLRKKLMDGTPLDSKGTTFREVALEWADAHDKKIASEKDRVKKRNRMDSHLLPFIGGKDISEITAQEILPVFQRLAERGNFETLSRIRSITSQIFRYGVATGRCSGDPTYALRGAIIMPKKRHYPSPKKPEEVGMLMRAIDAYPHDTVRCAMQFSALTFCRPGEIRKAEWSEISGDEWHISEKKMKMRRPHIVPLSRQAIDVLEKTRQLTGHGRYIFPSNRDPNGNRPMSDSTVLVALRAMGYTKDQMTPHGFRSMASTLLNENGFNSDWIERQLAHVEGNGVRAAYNYAEYLPERRKMMQWWASYLDKLREEA
ncbi:MAG: tyrosine-type recombinase/integrase [Synergistaceae bacterium]|jgi:integrase|nr:tyrosine-type recombinase/integrase [Synergistaceae bacterium]